MSTDALLWTYVGEILTDTQFGFVASVHYSGGVLVSLDSEWMMKYLRPDGTFMTYTVVTFLGYVFMLIYLKETNGLSDK